MDADSGLPAGPGYASSHHRSVPSGLPPDGSLPMCRWVRMATKIDYSLWVQATTRSPRRAGRPALSPRQARDAVRPATPAPLDPNAPQQPVDPTKPPEEVTLEDGTF